MRKSVGQTPTAERENKCNKKTCRTSSDIGAEQENHNVGRGPTLDRKGLNAYNPKPSYQAVRTAKVQYANAPQCYVMCTLPILFRTVFI
jgi:hypothetical protein